MSKFKIITPVPGWEGVVGEREAGVPRTRFEDGVATLDVVDQGTASRLAYFRSAGYIVEALDDVSAEIAIRSAVLTPGDEVRTLEAENAELRKVAEIETLRAENAKLRKAAVEAKAAADAPAPVKADDAVPVPDANASVDEWRAYGELALGLSAADARGMSKVQLQRREGDRAAAAAIEGGDGK